MSSEELTPNNKPRQPTRPLHMLPQTEVITSQLGERKSTRPSVSHDAAKDVTPTNKTNQSTTNPITPRPGFNGFWRSESDTVERKVVMKKM